MDAVAKQFLGLFEDFLQFSQLEDWPNNDTLETEIKNAFLMSHHIEKCLDKLQRRNIINEFLSVLNNGQDTSNFVLKNSFTDPPKYVLKKIIGSNTKVTQIDVGFKIFLQIFSEERLEKALSDIMLEAASKETLLRNLSVEIPKEKIIEFKSKLLLNELNNCEDPKDAVITMIDNCTQDTVELLVISLINRDLNYHNAVNNIVNTFILIMLKRNHSYKNFWKFLFKVEEEHFIKLCLEHADLCKIIVKALLDSGKLHRENMSADFFYIDLTYSELVGVVQRICQDHCLRQEFEDIVRSKGDDWEFWENMLPS